MSEKKGAKPAAKRADGRARAPESGMQRVLVYRNRTTRRGGLGLSKRFEWRPKP